MAPAFVSGWRRLQSGASLPTQSHAFSAALACTLLAGALVELFVVPGSDGLAALLPLYRNPGLFARRRLMGTRDIFEPCDALCDGPASARQLADAIVADRRPLALERLPACSHLIPALKSAMRRRGLVVIRPGVGCPTLPLDPSWSDPESRFNSGRRSDFRRAARRAAGFGAVTYEVRTPALHEFEALFAEAAAVEQRGWKQHAGTAIGSDGPKADFFRAFFRAACEDGSLRIAFMRVDGRAVAMQLAIESLGRYWLFKIGYDEAFARCSPGTLLMLHSLRHAASRNLEAFEFLGQAEPWIGELWTRESHACVRLRTYPFGLRGAVALAADALFWARMRLKRAFLARA